MIGLAISAAALASWGYLLAFRGGFWLTRERDGDSAGAVTPHLPIAQWAPSSPGGRGEGNTSPGGRGRGPRRGASSEGEGLRSQVWPAVAVIVPARNEADVIAASLSSLLAQDYPGPFRILLIDDDSADGTAEAARALADPDRRLSVVRGAPLRGGWTGKLWAMSQGVETAAEADYLLFTDADIAHASDNLRALVERAQAGGLVLTSLMARLKIESLADKGLIPAFVLFFSMVFPFAWANDPRRPMAAAAGGCMLVARAALQRAGGLAAIRGAIIDDCALAALLKPLGPIWLGLTNRARSLRAYRTVPAIAAMIARSAYAQLRYSPVLLAGTLAGLGLTFLSPPALAILGTGWTRALGAASWAAMAIAFQPMLAFYRRSPLWGLAAPAIAALYAGFTLASAVQVWRGRGGVWKGRAQALAAS
ncbi:MAG TPA: glycosyltransferase [Caulobacteraceae bacterium]|nr:glycosyltransferase [Caulobacteraceae bacterium]